MEVQHQYEPYSTIRAAVQCSLVQSSQCRAAPPPESLDPRSDTRRSSTSSDGGCNSGRDGNSITMSTVTMSTITIQSRSASALSQSSNELSTDVCTRLGRLTSDAVHEDEQAATARVAGGGKTRLCNLSESGRTRLGAAFPFAVPLSAHVAWAGLGCRGRHGPLAVTQVTLTAWPPQAPSPTQPVDKTAPSRTP